MVGLVELDQDLHRVPNQARRRTTSRGCAQASKATDSVRTEVTIYGSFPHPSHQYTDSLNILCCFMSRSSTLWNPSLTPTPRVVISHSGALFSCLLWCVFLLQSVVLRRTAEH